nr:tripeptidyl-peptidase sed2 [Quercus suber]
MRSLSGSGDMRYTLRWYRLSRHCNTLIMQWPYSDLESTLVNRQVPSHVCRGSICPAASVPQLTPISSRHALCLKVRQCQEAIAKSSGLGPSADSLAIGVIDRPASRYRVAFGDAYRPRARYNGEGGSSTTQPHADRHHRYRRRPIVQSGGRCSQVLELIVHKERAPLLNTCERERLGSFWLYSRQNIMFYSTLAWSLPLLGSAIAAPTAPSHRSYAVKESHPVPRGWSAVSRPHDAQMINLQIGLKQSNEDVLDKHLSEVSDPSHHRYGQYLSAEEIHELVKPADEAIEMVHAWLREHDVSSVSVAPAKDWINVVLPVSKVEELLETKYSVYKHTDGSSLVRAPEWSLPKHLHEHIDVVQPTTSFFRTSRQVTDVAPEEKATASYSMDWWKSHGPSPYVSTRNATVRLRSSIDGRTQQHHKPGTACDISCLRCLYGTIDYTVQVPEKNGMSVTNYLMETQNRSDLHLYLENYRPEAAAAAYTFPITVVANGPDQQTPLNASQIANGQGIEGDLDGELAIGISWPTKFQSWVTGGSPPFIPDLANPTVDSEPYVVWLQYVLAQRSLPQVISTSYGDDEQTVPYSYAKKACDGFKQLGVRGISVLFSSGDAGVGSNGTCFSNTEPGKATFVPEFPATCPFVTTVGGTQGFAPEVAVQRFGSGAGFSNYFAQPAYQRSAVEGYFGKIGSLYAGLYNRTGRGYPDVAAQGNHDVIVYNGRIRTVGGTSASVPTFAAIIALVNDALIAKGRPALGFLNPWIYGGAYKALTDVTSGSAIGCDSSGFPAEVGWDAVTGFGTPNLPKLIAAAFKRH